MLDLYFPLPLKCRAVSAHPLFLILIPQRSPWEHLGLQEWVFRGWSPSSLSPSLLQVIMSPWEVLTKGGSQTFLPSDSSVSPGPVPGLVCHLSSICPLVLLVHTQNCCHSSFTLYRTLPQTSLSTRGPHPFVRMCLHGNSIHLPPQLRVVKSGTVSGTELFSVPVTYRAAPVSTLCYHSLCLITQLARLQLSGSSLSQGLT